LFRFEVRPTFCLLVKVAAAGCGRVCAQPIGSTRQLYYFSAIFSLCYVTL